MKQIAIISIIILGLFSACKSEADFPGTPGNPQITAPQVPSDAFFADSIPFSATVSDTKVPLSTLKAQLFYGDVMVSETIIRTKTDGTYSGKIFAPFYRNIPDGTATLKMVLQDIHFTSVEQEFPVALKRPQYEYVTVVPESGESFNLYRTANNTYSALTGESIPQMMTATILAPKYGENGNAITFGWEENGVKENSTSPITFLSLDASPYEVTFNTLTYERGPFTLYKLNGKEMDFENGKFQIDLDLKKGELITTENIADISNFWIDPDFFTQNAEGQIQFAAINGKYRIIVEEGGVPYLRVQTLSSDGSKAKLQADGSGAIWIAGWGIAKPAMTVGQPGWSPGQMLCMAPVEPKVYRIMVMASNEQGAGQIRNDWIGFKFFHQDNWGGEFGGDSFVETAGLIPSVVSISGSGDFGFASGQGLVEGKTYVLTIDCTDGADKAKVSLVEK